MGKGWKLYSRNHWRIRKGEDRLQVIGMQGGVLGVCGSSVSKYEALPISIIWNLELVETQQITQWIQDNQQGKTTEVE